MESSTATLPAKHGCERLEKDHPLPLMLETANQICFGTVQRAVQKLKQEGVLKGYHAVDDSPSPASRQHHKPSKSILRLCESYTGTTVTWKQHHLVKGRWPSQEKRDSHWTATSLVSWGTVVHLRAGSGYGGRLFWATWLSR